MTTMSIIDTKEWTLWPVLMSSMFRLHNVQNDRYSIFIVTSYKTLVGVSGICSHDAISLHTAFSRFMVRNHYSCAWLQRHFLCLIRVIIFMDHLIYIQSCEWLDRCLHSCRWINLLLIVYISSICLKKGFEIVLTITHSSIWCSNWVVSTAWELLILLLGLLHFYSSATLVPLLLLLLCFVFIIIFLQITYLWSLLE